MNQAHATLAPETLTMPAPLEPGRRRQGIGSSVMVGASLALHACLAAVLGGLPVIHALAPSPEDLLVEVEYFEPPPAPAALPEPVVAPEPEPEIVESVRERRVEPTPVAEPEPTPEPEVVPEEPPPPVASAVPPSVDDVFGDPPPPMDSLTGAGGDFAVPAGEPGGAPGGRPGGTAGGTVGAGGTGAVATASGTDDAGARRRARDAYKREIERFLREHMTYPRAAARERIEGRVELALRIGADGALLGVRVASSSGSELLDREAVATAEEAGRLPAPPEPCGLRPSDELRVGVVYRLR